MGEEYCIMKDKKKTIGAVLLFIFTIVVFGSVFLATKPNTHHGDKEVSLVVVNEAGEETDYNVQTDAEYLIEVMEDAKKLGLKYDGVKDAYGMMISEVNGERALYEENQAYWGFSVNGEYCEYGVSQQPVEDGDCIEIKYTKSEP